MLGTVEAHDDGLVIEVLKDIPNAASWSERAANAAVSAYRDRLPADAARTDITVVSDPHVRRVVVSLRGGSSENLEKAALAAQRALTPRKLWRSNLRPVAVGGADIRSRRATDEEYKAEASDPRFVVSWDRKRRYPPPPPRISSSSSCAATSG